MADKNTNKPLLPSKAPRGNYQIWVILATIAVILGVMYINNSSDLKEVTQYDFEQMVRSGDVRKVALIKNQELVEITLKPEALQNAKYRQDINESPLGSSTAGPHYKLRITSIDRFDEKFEELTKKLPDSNRPEYISEKREDYFGVFIQWGFLFLLLFGFWMLMRRMTGGGGPGGQIFNIGKSKAALFDAENKVKITFEDVAGLDEAKEEVKEIVDFLKM
jgi:AFG3 family protein